MAVLLVGLITLFFALDDQAPAARWPGRSCAASAAATLALYGAFQAVDGVALKQAVNAWAGAPGTEKAARLATAEALRWLEWGLRCYQDVAMGPTLFLAAAAVARAVWLPQTVATLIGLSGLAYLAQGWVAGIQGFSSAQSVATVPAWVLSLGWMIWLAVVSLIGQSGMTKGVA